MLLRVAERKPAVAPICLIPPHENGRRGGHLEGTALRSGGRRRVPVSTIGAILVRPRRASGSSPCPPPRSAMAHVVNAGGSARANRRLGGGQSISVHVEYRTHRYLAQAANQCAARPVVLEYRLGNAVAAGSLPHLRRRCETSGSPPSTATASNLSVLPAPPRARARSIWLDCIGRRASCLPSDSFHQTSRLLR